MDIGNKFVVGGSGSGKVTILNPPQRGALLEADDALLLAAYLLALSMRPMEDFVKVYEEVCSA